jgi:pimeloyl-ACP methyl ester carboxylesterase
MGTLIRCLLLAVGMLAAVPLLVVLFLLPSTPITFVGSLYLLGCILIAAGVIGAPWRRFSALVLLGTSLILATMALRMVFPPSGSRLALTTFPTQSGPRWWNRILNEQDVVLFGTRLAPYLGLISPAENNGLLPALAETYGKMQGVTPLSPFLMTYLNQQHPDAFDALIAEPGGNTPPKRGIVFLHGYGGNFTLQCWLMAHAADRIGALTICPSTGPAGDWWSASGQAILQQTLSYLRQRGIERIYLAGLSNGGMGVSRLAHRFEPDLAGLILISGADPDAPITKLPVLVVQGKADERVPSSMVERYATAAGTASTYLLVEGDHFVLLRRAEQVQSAIADWVMGQEAHSAKEQLKRRLLAGS